MLEYRVMRVRASNDTEIRQFEQHVGDAINHGFEPLGGVSLSEEKDADGSRHVWLAQALLKR